MTMASCAAVFACTTLVTITLHGCDNALPGEHAETLDNENLDNETVKEYSMDQQYNCYSRDMRLFWTDEKKEWCCANKNIGCPYNCLSRELWTDEKREWCCTNKQLGCLATPEVSRAASQQHNCYSRDVRDFWTDEKKIWCCANKEIGCPQDKELPAPTSGLR
jgi:hypothetical protein